MYAPAGHLLDWFYKYFLDKGTAKIAKELGYDYAEAVVCFSSTVS